jgi:hypothetical protein
VLKTLKNTEKLHDGRGREKDDDIGRRVFERAGVLSGGQAHLPRDGGFSPVFASGIFLQYFSAQYHTSYISRYITLPGRGYRIGGCSWAVL